MYFKDGKKSEGQFANDLVSSFGGVVAASTKEEDIKKHIDLYWTPDGGKTCSFDVKGLRKNDRKDHEYSSDNTWIEFLNVHGEPGSLYGEEDYISFETDSDWLVVNRKNFAEAVKACIVDEKLYLENPNENFKLYRRKGREDIIMRIPISFVRRNSVKIIPKAATV
jgi:hypothetical protein